MYFQLNGLELRIPFGFDREELMLLGRFICCFQLKVQAFRFTSTLERYSRLVRKKLVRISSHDPAKTAGISRPSESSHMILEAAWQQWA